MRHTRTMPAAWRRNQGGGGQRRQGRLSQPQQQCFSQPGKGYLPAISGSFLSSWTQTAPLDHGLSGNLSNISWSDCFLTKGAEKNGHPKVHCPKNMQGNLDAVSSLLALATLWFEKDELCRCIAKVALSRQQAWEQPPQQQRSIMLVGGDSSLGKSALVSKLRQQCPRCASNNTNRGGAVVGIHAAAKCAFLHQVIPHTGITKAMRKVCQSLEKDHSLSEEQHKESKEALGSSVVMLAKLAPSALNLLQMNANNDSAAEPSANEDSDNVGTRMMENAEETQNWFCFATSTFLHVVAGWMPVILVLNDVQWANAALFGLLKFWLNNPKLQELVLVGCHWSNEVDEMHLLAQWMQDLDSGAHDICLTKVNLSNLELNAVNKMIADALRMDSHCTMGLAVAVHKKRLAPQKGNGMAFKEPLGS